jgi:Ca2+-binding RTX toxin-like protein
MANIFGNALDNTLTGGIFSDNIFGFGGNDRLFGNGANDFLVGSSGNDLLNGGIGADVMVGGTGNDTYIVDNGGDLVVEDIGEGLADRVVSSINFTLNAPGRFAIENLTLTGAAIVGTGNSLGNQLVGNGFGNVLQGLAGNDVLLGNGGNDTMFGGVGADSLSGGIGNDRMTGGLGRDVLTGGAGNDLFDYNAAAESPANALRDVITDFDDFGNDTIDLSGVSAAVLTYRGLLPFSGINQVRINDIAGPDVIVEVNLAGTPVPEMQIHLVNTFAFNMTATDFIL